RRDATATPGPRPPPAPRPALDRGRDHEAQQLADAHAPRAQAAARPRVELREALLERDEPAHARHADGAPRAVRALLAAGAARRRGRAARALVALLPGGVALRRDVRDPAEHPRRARARAAAR